MGRDKLTVKGIKAAPQGTLQDGAGLMLVKMGEAGKWIWRYSFAGKRRDMGLGKWPDVGLADARKARDRWAAVMAEGRDPISARATLIAEERAAIDRKDPTLAEAVQMAFDAKKGSLRGDGARGRWLSPLATHVLPKIGKRRIADLHQSDIATALRPIWKAKHPTAEKAIQRLGIVFEQARLAGIDCDPFTVKAARHMLGNVIHQVQHIAATDWRAVPDLWTRLQRPGASYACLRWMILTLARSDAARGARHDEIEGDVWTIPADRMKGRAGAARAFRVPLVPEAVRMAAEAAEWATGPHLFPSYKIGAHITSTALAKAMDGLGEAGRPHGIRTAFRSWVQDTGAADYDVAETVLAHTVGGKVERSYARSDMLDRRRDVMERWAGFVMGAPKETT